jgi:hypothetical protein
MPQLLYYLRVDQHTQTRIEDTPTTPNEKLEQGEGKTSEAMIKRGMIMNKKQDVSNCNT